jgi:broad specificity phosphatase PhoE
MAEVLLVRHAQASFGADNYDQLSALGVQQARWLGQYCAARNLKFDRVVCGAQQRHRQTVAGILESLDAEVELQTLAGLDEFDFAALLKATLQKTGEAEPTRREDYYRLLKRALALWQQDALPGPLPESWEDFRQRTTEAMRDIQMSSARRTLVVSSGGPISVITAQVLEAPSHTVIELNLQIRNTALTQFFSNAQAIRLLSFNALPHLDHPERFDAITYA